jgi:predicted alpha/beta superfamily hydrolase
MRNRILTMLVFLTVTCARPLHAAPASAAVPLTIGESFTIDSKVLGETRRINIYRAPFWGDSASTPRPVMYMLDGGIAEDFLHIAGLLQVSIGNETMRPFLLVGIENTQRRRDLTGPTEDPEDRKIAPQVGGSAAFREFLRSEVIPAIEARYPTTRERALMGESLAGLFVVETFFRAPEMFDTYIAFDPSLWWNKGAMAAGPLPRLAPGSTARTLYMAASSEERIQGQTRRLAERIEKELPTAARCLYAGMPGEKHATIYHPAALRAVRALFAPTAH